MLIYIPIRQRLFALESLASSMLVVVAILLPTALASALPAGSFGSGSFGNCSFGSCSITITTSGSSGCSGSVCLNVTPTSAGKCSVNSDTVNVQTQYSGGYVLTLGNTNSSSALTNGSSTIAAISGTYASPVSLTANTWGYRLDSIGNFGSGPTSVQTNTSISSISSLAFAQTEVNTNSADTLANTSGASSLSGDNYAVWYGLCVNNTVGYGSYSSSVTYTAITN